MQNELRENELIYLDLQKVNLDFDLAPETSTLVARMKIVALNRIACARKKLNQNGTIILLTFAVYLSLL